MSFETDSNILVEHDPTGQARGHAFRKTGFHFSGSCSSSSGNLPTIYSRLRRSRNRSPTSPLRILRSRRMRSLQIRRSLQSQRSLYSHRRPHSLYSRNHLRTLYSHRRRSRRSRL